MSDDLLQSPCWQAQHLGRPMPDDPHAVSACLPLWSHNIAYEEGDAAVVDALQAAYPRFCLHPDVRRLCERLFPDGHGLPFASAAAADRAIAYVQHCGGTARRVPIPNQSAVGVAVNADDFAALKQYWQHAGEIVSSRVAAAMLADTPALMTESDARAAVRQRVADYHHVSPDDVYLFASGMAAIAAAWRAVQRVFPDRPTAQFGFPYVDTLKIQERFPPSNCDLYALGDETDATVLEATFLERKFAAVLCETPTNPLLMTPNLKRLRKITDRRSAALIVDDTLRAFTGDSVLPLSDVVCTSLTKYFSGYGNVLAGALVVNREGGLSSRLRNAIADDFDETLSDLDVEVLERNSRDVNERVRIMAGNARELVARLKQHPAVESVYYPFGGDACGSLFSMVLRDAERVTPAVFDALRMNKGPNLGTNFTLCCPFTILAHYDELDFAESCGVSRWLLRFSVGMESVDDLCERMEAALSLVETS